MSSYYTFAKHFGANLAKVAKYPLAVIGVVICAVLGTAFIMGPSLVGQYIVYDVTPIEMFTMENPPNPPLTHPIWIAQYLYWFVGFPIMWAAGKSYLEVRSDE